MPLRIPDRLPAIDLLKEENIFVMDHSRATTQDIRPLRIVILNLMPLKITTETDLLRLLSNTPLQLEIMFMRLKSHTPKNTPIEHMMLFYKDFEILKTQKFDGMIVTGAPIEQLDYEEVSYWEEMKEILGDVKLGDRIEKEKILPILKDATIFGVDLEEYGLADKVVAFLNEELEGIGAVRNTLKKYM